MAVLPSLDNLRALLQRVIFVPIVYGFISLLPMFLSGWENSDRLADRLFSTIRSKENMFDFIVVGGGTAGALVANRLAEHYRVLLLEAGGTPSPFQTIPALALKFLNHPQTDWSHKTVPQRKACLNSINQQSSWSAGRGLGGTTNINFMTHVRGNQMDFENWKEITGDPSWGYSGVLPYFKRYETFSGTSNDPEARGHDGEFRIRKPSYIGLSEDWIRAGQELGYPFVDLNGRHEEGFGILQYPMYKGIRQSTYAAFLLPMHKSPRLTIRRYALVRKVLFRDMNNMAYGVEYVRHGKIETAIATKEVVLSAGTLGSSKLLMLSGVGPRAHLEELGIPVRSDLPVGRNLQDHLAVHLGPFFIKEPKSFLFDRDVTPENIVRWLFLGTGPITTTGYQGAASIVSSVAKSRNEGNWPDINLLLHGQSIHQGYTDAFAYAYSLQEDELMQYYSNAVGRDSFHIYVIGSRPTSTGQVLLSGASISDPLVINPRYLEDGGNGDFKILLEGVKTAFNIANTSMFQRLGTEFTQTKLPGCHELDLGTDAYWECYIRRFTLTMQNPVGTVALGAVVDPSLKVRGTRGLRVADASIQPTIVSTSTAASVLMIAEKAVDIILKEHGIPDRETDLFDVIFGKNGFFKRNPILKILQREIDTLNPLRALFKPLISNINAENDAKERFTRNGRFDNPFLQVISTVFGNVGLPQQGDNSVSSTSNIDNKLKTDRKLDDASFHRRSTDGFSTGKDENANVISKNQWVLQTVPETPTFSLKPVANQIQHQSSVSLTVIKTSTGLNITELSVPEKKKGKGGKRYALLQKILREQERNATLAKFAKTIIDSPPPLITQSTSTVKPVVEIVKFEKASTNVSVSENEIRSDSIFAKNSNTKTTTVNNGTSAAFIVAKLAEMSPPSLLPANSSSLNDRMLTTPSPFNQLLKSLSSFGAFMNSLARQDNRPGSIIPTVTNVHKQAQAVSKPLNVLQNINENVLSFLAPLGNNGNTTNIFFPKSNDSPATKNPFAFLFGTGISPTPPTNSLKNYDAAKNGANAENSSGVAANGNKNVLRHDRSNFDLFASWFKPVPKNQSASAWFKPLDKALIQPAPSVWSAETPSWFKPFNFNDQSKPSWFKPLNLNSHQHISKVATDGLKSPQSPSESSGNLFELFFGDLKKYERMAVSKTLDTILQAGESLADILGVPPSSYTSTAQNSVNVFEQIAKGKRNVQHKEQETGKSESAIFLKSLIALNNVLKSHSSTEKPTTLSINNSTTEYDLFDHSYVESETTPIHIRIPITKTIAETTTTPTLLSR